MQLVAPVLQERLLWGGSADTKSVALSQLFLLDLGCHPLLLGLVLEVPPM